MRDLISPSLISLFLMCFQIWEAWALPSLDNFSMAAPAFPLTFFTLDFTSSFTEDVLSLLETDLVASNKRIEILETLIKCDDSLEQKVELENHKIN